MENTKVAFSSSLRQKNNIQNIRIETDALQMKEHCVLCKYLEEVLGIFSSYEDEGDIVRPRAVTSGCVKH